MITLVLALVACSPDEGPTETTGTPSPTPTGSVPTADTAPDPCTVPSVTVGTGVKAYKPLQDGDSVTVVFGPQGGWHVDVAGLVTGTEQIVSVLPSLTWSAKSQSLTGALAPLTLAQVPTKPCGFTFFGVRAIFDDELLPKDAQAFVCGLDGEDAELEVTVTDPVTGATATEGVTVTLTRDPKQVCP